MQTKILLREEFETYLPQFVELYKKCFSGNIDERYFRWRYLERSEVDLLVAVAVDSGRVVGFRGISPWIIRHRDKNIKSGVALNAMAHPDYAGRGLWSTLAGESNEHARLLEYDVIIQYPNYISNRICNTKLGGRTIYEIPSMELTLTDVNLDLDVFRVSRDDKFELVYDDSSYMREERAHVIKDGAYLRWRYYQNPMNEYVNLVIQNQERAEGFAVCKQYENKLNIVDIGFMNMRQAEILLKNAINYAKESEKECVTIWAPINTELHLLLEKMRFKNNYPIQYFGIIQLSKDKQLEGLNNYSNWFVQLGDNCSVY